MKYHPALIHCQDRGLEYSSNFGHADLTAQFDDPLGGQYAAGYPAKPKFSDTFCKVPA